MTICTFYFEAIWSILGVNVALLVTISTHRTYAKLPYLVQKGSYAGGFSYLG
ncbi:MAG: hypothetical protein F6K17_16795 [Okeania sp. SIO3C4]|nr:hypothetical protein [Okeania sp. SIO3B3]NER04151.1 hypothetical protein [Okeania sp. SIO3C4]